MGVGNYVRRAVCIDSAVGQIERGLHRGLPTARRGLVCLDYALDLYDGGDIWLPFRAGDHGLCLKHGNGSCFVAIALFRVDGLDAGKRRDRRASGLGRLTEGWLVVLELNDQMHVGGGGGFEGFF